MNCHACQYQKQIDALRRRCLACNPESDGGTPHGRVKADEFTLNTAPKAEDFSRVPSGRATGLSSEDEHKLRLAMTSLFGLDPLDLLLVQHLMRGETLEEFASKLDDLSRQIRRYHGSARAMAWARKSSILHKMPMLAAVLQNNRENDAAVRIAKEIEDANRD